MRRTGVSHKRTAILTVLLPAMVTISSSCSTRNDTDDHSSHFRLSRLIAISIRHPETSLVTELGMRHSGTQDGVFAIATRSLSSLNYSNIHIDHVPTCEFTIDEGGNPSA
jgi:hypothetical protein